MTRTELEDFILLNIDDNNNNEIDYARMRAVLNNLIDVILPSATAAVDGRVPYVDNGAYTSADALKVLNGIVTAQKMALKYGIPFADYIHNAGAFTGIASQALVTKRYVDGRRVVVGVIPTNIDLATGLRVGDSVTLEGGTAHTVAAGDCFLLQGQTTVSENTPWEAVSAEDEPIRPDWYDKNKNLEILIETGDIKRVLPASGEGDPVARPDSGKLAFNFFAINNF